MRLEDITAAIRPRSDWEAVDLGFVLVRKRFGPLIRLWLASVVPLWALLSGVLWQHPHLVFLIVWFLKPAYDMLVLHFLSRDLFGAPPAVGEAVKAWPGLVFRGFFRWILGFRRFSLQRSFRMPVWQLEGLKGRDYRQRVNVLGRRGGDAATKAALGFSLIELSVFFGLYTAVVMCIPSRYLPDAETFFQDLDAAGEFNLPLWFTWVVVGIYMVTVTFIESFYVAAGFAVYLNSRTHLEGWDVELAFRRMSERLSLPSRTNEAGKLSGTGSKAALLALACGLAGSFASGPSATAQESVEDGPSSVIRDILTEEDFKVHKVERWEFEGEERERSRGPSWSLAPFFEAMARLLFVGAVVAAIVGLVYLIYTNRHAFGWFRGQRDKAPRQGPRVVMGMEVSAESLPDDYARLAWERWQKGKFREALSLLYRGAICWLVEKARLPIVESDTETDCLLRVSELPDSGRVNYFRELTSCWISLAYARTQPSDDTVRWLCENCPFDLRESKAR